MYSVYLSNKNANGGYDEVMIFNDKLDDKSVALIDPSLSLESGTSGSFDFTMPPCNAGYGLINPMTTEVIVKKKSKEVWRGRVLNPESDFYNQVKVECEGELSYFNDTYQPQHEYKTETLRQVIEGILSIHNRKVATYDEVTGLWTPNPNEPIDKVFYVGACFVSDDTTDPTGTDKSYRATDYETTLECLKKIADTYKGYFIVEKREVNGVVKRFLDFKKDFDGVCTQRIDFGENLLDFTKSFKMEDLCTVAMPIGGSVKDTDFTEADEMYIYRTENDIPIDYLNRNGEFGHDGAGDREAGVVYLNEYGLKTGDKVYVNCTQYHDQAEIKDGIWAFATENGTVIADTIKYCNSTVGVETYEKHELTIPAGAQRLRVASTTFENPRLKVYKQKAESGLDEHFTIAPYAEVDDENFKHIPGDVYVIYKPLYEKYGWHEKKLEFNNLEKSEDLWNMTTYWLTHTQFEQMTLEVTALDLSYLNVNYEDIWINMNIPVYSLPHGLTDNLVLPCTKMTIKLGSIENSEYTLGYTTPTEISNIQNSVNADISKLMDQVPTYSDTFKSIQENATNIINSMYEEGYVTFVHDPTNMNQIKSIVIADNPDPDLATQKWVWTQGGLGYQKKEGGSWSNFDVAMTKDGWIVGKFIAAHTLTADSIGAGTLKIGHYTYTDLQGNTQTVDGLLQVLNGDGNVMLEISRDYGVTANGDNNKWARLKNGKIFGGYGDVYEEGSNCAGSINFHNTYGSTPGLDVRTKIFGINSDGIWVSQEFDNIHSAPEPGLSTEFDLAGKHFKFIHGILTQVYNVNNGGE